MALFESQPQFPWFSALGWVNSDFFLPQCLQSSLKGALALAGCLCPDVPHFLTDRGLSSLWVTAVPPQPFCVALWEKEAHTLGFRVETG